MRTNRISIGVLTLIIVSGVSQRATAVEPTIIPFAEPLIEAGWENLPVTGEAAAMIGATGCETIGGFDRGPFGGPNRWRADIIEMTSDAVLTRIEIDLRFFGLADLYFTVHEQCNASDPFERIGPENIVQRQGNEAGDFTLRTYSSDIYDPLDPVLLQTGCRYAFGVSWAVDVFFVLDDQVYPTTDDGFQDGKVVGSSGLPLNGGPPVADTINSLVLATGGAYLMNICLAPKPGACCLGGDCQELVLDDCQAAGGVFTAERFTCEDLDNEAGEPDDEDNGCPLVSGGCCLPNGACINLDRFACESEANAGTWNMVVCDPDGFLCAPHGACCHEEEEGVVGCSDFAERECETEEGTYQGDDSNCAEDGLACNFGACCSGETCLLLSESACAAILAVWQDGGSVCDESTCDPPGACCFGEECEDAGDGMNLARCAAAGGVYQGNFSSCDTLSAACGRGACCAPLFGCVSDLSQQNCENIPNGTFGGVGSDCATLEPACPGTCCWLGGCLSDKTPSECADFPEGVFDGYLVDCPGTDPEDPDPCNNETKGACCLNDGSCVETTDMTACDRAGGTYQNDGTTCVGQNAVLCEAPVIAACCIAGRCEELTSAECADANGVFAANGELCTVELCVTGACCHDDDTTCEGPPKLDNIRIEDCGTGNFYAGRSCDICPRTGACCLPAPAGCENRTQGSCEAAGGQFAGEDVFCPPDGVADCSVAACCQDDGTCRDTISALCDPTDHDPNGSLCVVVGGACPAAEACCLPDGSCDDLTLEACETPVPDGFGGTPQGPGTVCDADTCTEGACCVDGECRDGLEIDDHDGLTIDECTDLNGTHQGVATVCTEDTCTHGACCRPGAFGEPRFCEDGKTIIECTIGLEGDHEGVGTICTEDSCTEGACCVPEEPGSPVTNCFDGLTIDECADNDGEHRGRDTICLDGGLCTEGACCRDGGSCNNNKTENECAGFGETHLGRGSICSGSLCLQGACCINDGTCRDDVVFGNCPIADGMFQFGETCATLTEPCDPSGACCDDNDNCSQLTRAACSAQGGTHFGDGLLCNGSECPGACCLEGGNCLKAAEDDCDGDFDPSRTCETIVCGGSCCRADGTCQFVSEVDCASGDVFSPDQTCEQSGCEARGACCRSGGCLSAVTESACNSGGGLYLGDSSACDASLCILGACCRLDGGCETGVFRTLCSGVHDRFDPSNNCMKTSCVERAACCVTDQPCQILTRAECDDANGEFGVPGTDCDDPSACTVAACCLAENKRCGELPRIACERDGGFYREDLTVCELVCSFTRDSCVNDDGCRTCEGDIGAECIVDADCPNGVMCIQGQLCVMDECTRRACCDADGDCTDRYRINCTDLQDEFFVDTGCSALEENDCAAKRACCKQDVCVVTTRQDCLADGGAFIDALRECRDDLCEIGACCFSDGSCIDDQTGRDCFFLDGSFQGGVTTCEQDGMCHACCTGDQGSCVNAIESVCTTELGGVYNANAECSSSPCAGACCDNGQCKMIDTLSACAGVYHGDGTSCDPDLCDLGACCGRDGNCIDRVIETVCDETNGFFHKGVDCGLITCDPVGACCENGECAQATAANCRGVFLGEFSLCDGAPCELGSCCGTDGVCDSGFVASQCVDPGDVFSLLNDCGAIICVTRGACCDGGICTVLSEAACGGVYQGDTSVCDTETCDIGSCCAEAGGCTDSVVASQCAALGDVFRQGVDCAKLPCVPPCGMADLTGIVFADDDPVAPLALDQPGHCAIDAREPHDINDVNARDGWNRMVMSFSCDPAEIGLVPGDFTVTGVPVGVVPGVLSVPIDSVANIATVMLDDTITPGQWTCIAHPGSGGQWCMGYLPSDAGQDGLSSAGDINKLINSINLVPGAQLPIYATDMNRSGITNGQDILRLIDLLNGAGDFTLWITQGLAPCPTP